MPNYTIPGAVETTAVSDTQHFSLPINSAVTESSATTSGITLGINVGVFAMPAYRLAKTAEHVAYLAWKTGVDTVATDYTTYLTALTNYTNNSTGANKALVTSAYNTWQSDIATANTQQAAWQVATDQIWFILSTANHQTEGPNE